MRYQLERFDRSRLVAKIKGVGEFGIPNGRVVGRGSGVISLPDIVSGSAESNDRKW